MNTDIDKIFNRVKRHGNSWAFSCKDFTDLANTTSIITSLHRLWIQNKIRRIFKGIYDLPRYSTILEEYMPPDIHKVAHALARKFSWSIQPTGNTALNRLNLSTQVPSQIVYLSDGPNRKYSIEGQDLSFKKAPLVDSKLKYNESKLVVQAIRTLGKGHIDQQVVETIRDFFSRAKLQQIEKETQYTTAWIYDVIKQICNYKETS
ncbi:DUF6088 family protein [bacterium]|nr:DUF6088 family protein [bacterium]